MNSFLHITSKIRSFALERWNHILAANQYPRHHCYCTMRNVAIATASVLALITGTVANKDAITLITNGNSWIREAVATLVVPELPASVTGDIALWSAIMMDDYQGDFLQGVTSSSPTYV